MGGPQEAGKLDDAMMRFTFALDLEPKDNNRSRRRSLGGAGRERGREVQARMVRLVPSASRGGPRGRGPFAESRVFGIRSNGAARVVALTSTDAWGSPAEYPRFHFVAQ